MLMMSPFGMLKQNNEYNMKLCFTHSFEAPLRMVVVGCKSEWSGSEEAKIQIAVWIKYKLILNKFFSLASCPTFSLSTFILSLVWVREKKALTFMSILVAKKKSSIPLYIYLFARNAIKMITIWKRPFGKSVEWFCLLLKMIGKERKVFRGNFRNFFKSKIK